MKRLTLPSLSDALDEAGIGLKETPLGGRRLVAVTKRAKEVQPVLGPPQPVTYCPECQAPIYKANKIYCTNEHQRKAEDRRKASFTTEQPFLPNQIPKSSTRLVIDGLKILAYPNMHLVKKCKDLAELDAEFTRMSQLLQYYRLDLTRPFGTCPKCALPLTGEEHVCP